MAEVNVSSDEILKEPIEVTYDDAQQDNYLFQEIKSEDADEFEIDLSVKCRGCFAEDPEMHYLFTVFDQELSLADILMQITSFQCKEDDGFPPYLCTKCTSSLIDFFNFKIQFQKTDLYVRTLLGKAAHDPLDIDNVFVKNETYNSQYGDNDLSEPEDSFADEEMSETEAEVQKFHPDLKNISGASSRHCDECEIDFDSDGDCQTHMARGHGKNPFVKYHLFRNQIAEHEKSLILSRKRKRLMEADLKEVILMNTPGKLCRICRKKFPEAEFNVHWEQHKIHVCEDCGHRCIKRWDLETHRRCVHSDIRNYRCSLCDKTFKTGQLLKRHQVVHLNPRSYCCDSCGLRFNDSGTLKTHYQVKHIGTRNFICPICGLAFPMKPNLDKHIMRHNKDRPPTFHCEICPSSFRDKSSLNRHHLVKHTDNYIKPQCEQCGKRYYSTTKLNYHIARYHSGQKVERKRKEVKVKEEKQVEEEYNSGSQESESEESSNDYSGPRVRNVSENFYKRTERSRSENKDEDYYYRGTDYGSEVESTSGSNTGSESNQ